MKRCACGILIEERRILLGKRSPARLLYPGVWDMIGGHREDGESLDATLRREFEEEIEVTPSAFRELAVLAEPAPKINGERAYHVYAITAWGGARARPCAATSMRKSAGSPSPRRLNSISRSRTIGTC